MRRAQAQRETEADDALLDVLLLVVAQGQAHSEREVPVVALNAHARQLKEGRKATQATGKQHAANSKPSSVLALLSAQHIDVALVIKPGLALISTAHEWHAQVWQQRFRPPSPHPPS